MVAFATQVKRRRGTAEQNNEFTGAEGEIVVNLTDKSLRVHDGQTKGGFETLRQNMQNSVNITNCITYIPQDIKLELNNGTLTLKAGSKVYIPNGFETDGVTKKFDVINIVSDVALTQGWGSSQTFCLAVNKDGSGMAIYDIARTYSGTFTSYSSGFYYEEDKNLMNIYDNGVLNRQISFPIAIITGQSPTINSIDQVFNGFGYIGSTIFALRGVKGIMPSGRNADGTLKNTVFTVNNVITRKTSYDFNSQCVLIMRDTGIDYVKQDFYLESRTTPALKQYARLYQSTENQMYYGEASAWIKRSAFNFGLMTIDSSGKITSFSIKTPFRALDYNDAEYIAHQSMPSDRYVDLTLPASGGNITAPADGWIYLGKQSSAANQYIKLSNGTKGKTAIWSNAGSQDLQQTLPVNKGDTIQVNYTAGGAFQFFRFVYANGAK